VIVATAAAILSSAVDAGADDIATGTVSAQNTAPGGIWKAAVPKAPMHGEFENDDPLGVAAGVRIQADCSLNWIDPDDGKLYCFSSGTSLEIFIENPQANIQRARRAWRTIASAAP